MIQNKTWLKRYANIVKSTLPDDDGEIYVSKIDGSYITRVGMESEIRFLIKRGIENPQNRRGLSENSANIGFNPVEIKWYGWSHRAIYGFGIGSKVIKGDCAYQSTDKDDFLDDCIRFWTGEDNLNTKAVHTVVDGIAGVDTSWVLSDKIHNEELRGKMRQCFLPYPDEYGRGEWEAQTLSEARLMACDFARGVS